MLEDKLLAVAGLAGACSIQAYKALQGVVEDKSQPIEVLNAARKAMYQTKKTLFGETSHHRGGLRTMADNLKVTQGQEENVGEFGRGYSEKLQTLARGLVSGLYMLIRSVKMYDPENAVFEKPLLQLQDIVNQIISKEGRLELVGVKDSFYLNNMLVKVDLNSIDNQRYLLAEMRAKDVGGISLNKPVTVPDLKNFIWIFSKDQASAAEEDGLAGRKLLNMKVARFSKLKEKLNRDELANPDDQKVDRKKYAMTVYARAVFFLTKYLESVQAGKPMNTAKALRIVQDFVDISYEQKTHFLGMTTLKQSEADYLVYHQVNVCLMSIVFGMELGLTKAQLRDLGYIGALPRRGHGDAAGGAVHQEGRAERRGEGAHPEGAADLRPQHPDGEGLHALDAAARGDDVRAQGGLRHGGAGRAGATSR